MSKTYKFKVDTFDLENSFLKKECPGYPNLPTVIPEAERVVAIGDIHGDYELAIKLFKLAELIDDKLNWVAKPPTTIVVQVGDQIDSCRPYPPTLENPDGYDCHNIRKKNDVANDLKVLGFFDSMDKKARAKGGMVISLIGNHEIMNAQGILSYVSYANHKEFIYKVEPIVGQASTSRSQAVDNKNIYTGTQGRLDAFKPGGPIAKHIACSRLPAVIIGSNLFVHAGILPSLLNKIEVGGQYSDPHIKIAYINQVVARWLMNKLDAADKEDLHHILSGQHNSPFWPRILGVLGPDVDMGRSKGCYHTIGKVIQTLKIGKMIIGHTPQLYSNKVGVNGTCKVDGENTVFRVDGGFSNAFKIFENRNMIGYLNITDYGKKYEAINIEHAPTTIPEFQASPVPMGHNKITDLLLFPPETEN